MPGPERRVEIHRALREAENGFRDAARRRAVARDRRDLVGEAQAEQTIEYAFRRREQLLAELAGDRAGDTARAGVSPSAP